MSEMFVRGESLQGKLFFKSHSTALIVWPLPRTPKNHDTEVIDGECVLSTCWQEGMKREIYLHS